MTVEDKMIIEAPTALYQSILPVGQAAGNISWTISSNDPPRQSSTIPLLTNTDEYKELPKMIFNPACREFGVGEYVFNLSYTLASKAGAGRKQYESGQIIEFTQEALPDVDQLTVPDTVELQQNTNLIDLESLGLTEADVAVLDTDARKNMNLAIDDLNTIQANINTTKISINDNQKLINETRKAVSAASALFDIENPIVKKLLEKQYELVSQRDVLVSQLNTYISQANEKYDTIQRLREIVR